MTARASADGLQQRAAALLAADLDALADSLVALIRTDVPAYGTLSDLSRDELRESCRSNLQRSLRELVEGLPSDDGTATPQAETGRRRARQGLPLEALLHSYRLGGRVLWHGLVRHAQVEGDAGAAWRLLDEAGLVWEMIDRHSSVVASAYRAEQARLLQRTRQRRDALLVALLDGHGVDAEVVREAASVLGMPPEGLHCVVTAALDARTHEPLPGAEAALLAAGFVSAWVTRTRSEAGLVLLPQGRDVDELVAVLSAAAVGRVGVSAPVGGFDQVGRAARLADLALRTLPEDAVGVVTVLQRLPQALLAGGGALTALLVEQALGPVLALRSTDRDTYLDTLEALLDCDGHATAAARRLFCHRNTVLKRVQRLELLTGLRTTRTADVVLLRLALLAVRQAPARHLT